MEDTRDFLVQLNKEPNKKGEGMDFSIKNFMRVLFAGIYIRNQKVVRLDIHQPWKLCYEKGLECKKQRKAPRELQKMTTTNVSSIWRPTVGRWMRNRTTMAKIAKALVEQGIITRPLETQQK